MPRHRSRRRKGQAKQSNGGRRPKNPFDLEEPLKAYLALAKQRGTDEFPVDLKSIATNIGCSHTLFSPKRIAGAPVEYQEKWRELRELIDAEVEHIRGRRRTMVESLKEKVAALREELERAEREKELLWIWMIQIEVGLHSSGINTELFIPEDLRYHRAERRQVSASD